MNQRSAKRRATSFGELGSLRQQLADEQRREAEAKARAELAARVAKQRQNEFLKAVGDVVPLPLRYRDKVEHSRAPLLPVPLQRDADEREALLASMSDQIDVERLLDSDETLSYRRDGIAPEVLRKLRRGRWVVQAQLDLHGYRTDEAREAVAEFLRDCVQRDKRCVRIIHGKGLGSVNKEPVLKLKVRRWLQQREEVLAYCQAPAHDGGAGALLILLRSGPYA